MDFQKRILVLTMEPDLSSEPCNIRDLIDELKLYPQDMKLWLGTGVGQTPLLLKNISMDDK